MENEEAVSTATLDEMTRYGITKVSEDHYYHDGYHYMNLDDALAQASRGQSAADPHTTPEDLMARYGIVRRSIEYFRYGNFRYASLRDALSQARQHPPSAQ